jgi:hypothetical protein
MRFMDMPLKYHWTVLTVSASGLPRGVVRVNGSPHCWHSVFGLPAAEPLWMTGSLWHLGHVCTSALLQQGSSYSLPENIAVSR